MNKFVLLILGLGLFGLGIGSILAQETPGDVMSPAYRDLWNENVQKKIDADIEKYRKTDAEISIPDTPDGTTVHLCQTSSAFKFGSNIFLFGQLGSDEKNRAYADAFGDLFNGATVPFYWKTLEPERGKPRFAAGSPEIYRRPPTDPVVDYCLKRGVDIHGHALIYGMRSWGHPDWMPEDRRAMEPIFEEHLRQIAERYGDRISEWDVVNESIDQANRGLMPDDYTYKTFKWAEKYFPPAVKFSTNECDLSWGPNRRYVEIVRDLTDRGVKIDLMGVQSHLFSPKLTAAIAAGEKIYTPEKIGATLDVMAEAGKPIHISEITISAPSDDEKGRKIQAEIGKNLYRYWFSRPEVVRITWWNAVDGGAAEGEPSFSGIFTKELEKKPIYDALFDLIHRQWRTETDAIVTNGKVCFRGFRGDYRITWKDEAGNDREIDASAR